MRVGPPGINRSVRCVVVLSLPFLRASRFPFQTPSPAWDDKEAHKSPLGFLVAYACMHACMPSSSRTLVFASSRTRMFVFVFFSFLCISPSCRSLANLTYFQRPLRHHFHALLRHLEGVEVCVPVFLRRHLNINTATPNPTPRM